MLSPRGGLIQSVASTPSPAPTLLAAARITGYTPRLLIAPGFIHQRLEQTHANPVVAE
ncbi:hypothetical protein LPH50_10190 [Xylella taiwanensis]|uniref:Uncharacterized protein n=1 Tax=Xylella taiwanensis TaxID=1444770 RepID=A0ABS8TYK2_9GAMM|nr:hypothetical protein [Xylella taiwanensis]MCD8456298.1 hypothetical protein [Xylella taiwanensis]MCD8458707.1 hypothetical protein [Xylella taiwanensis]MCD8460842.1 hypothetical protein [Xylella taiwanensis]MCD8467094.1 hypothetical protein [Xylella taiwanensis]MCD8470570.1 hypothetical protein [Xylella taiwanensis]